MLRCLTIVHFNFFFVLLISNSAKWVSLEEISAIIRKPSKSVLSSRRDSIELKRTLLETKPTSCLNLAPNRHWKLWSVRENAPTHKNTSFSNRFVKLTFFSCCSCSAFESLGVLRIVGRRILLEAETSGNLASDSRKRGRSRTRGLRVRARYRFIAAVARSV